MAEIKNVLTLTAIASGTLNIPVQSYASAGQFEGEFVRIIGTRTLSGNLNISPTGTPVSGTRVFISWEAVVTASAGVSDVVIFGMDIPVAVVLDNFLFHALYDGSAWQLALIPNFDATGIIGAKQLATGAVATLKVLDANITLAKIQNVAANSLLVRDANSSGVLTEKALATTQILIGNGTGFTAAALSGVVTMTNAGVVSYVDASIATAKYQNASVTPTKMSANANKYTRDIRLSFAAAAEVGNINFTICEDCAIDEINVTVLSPATDDTATLVFKDNGGTVLTGSQVDVTTSLTLGNIVSTTPTANNVFAAGDNFLIEMSKTTKTSCKVNVSICITKV